MLKVHPVNQTLALALAFHIKSQKRIEAWSQKKQKKDKAPENNFTVPSGRYLISKVFA